MTDSHEDTLTGRALFKRLVLHYVSPYTASLIGATIAMIIMAGMTALNAWMMQPALDKVFLATDEKMLMMLPIAVIATALIKGIASFYQTVQMKYVGQRIVTDLQLALYAHLLHADLALLQQHTSGKLISRFTNDITVMRGAVSTVLTGVARESLSVIFLVGVMFYQNAALSLIAFVVFPVAVYPILRLGKRMRKIANQTQEELGHYTVQLDETLQGIRVVKAYRQEEAEIARAHGIVERIFGLYMKAARVASGSSPILETLSGIAIAAVIWYGGKQVMMGVTTPGSFFSFIAALIMAYKPLKSLADLNSNLQEGLAAARRLFSILDVEPTVIEAKDAKPLSLTQAHIACEHVSFGYRKDVMALKDLHFEVRPGEMVAFVGGSGSGKSTLMNLLLRFYDPSNGRITINGQDLRDVTLTSMRNAMAFVGQEVILFDDTVRANIVYGRPDAPDAEIIEAAKAAAAHDFIMALPEGYDTVIGERGLMLSGGQRQRLAIARALLRKSPILLLDEATSALDTLSEQHIQQAIAAYAKERTVIVIAHRLSTIVNADKIYVMKQGEIVESGTHQSLLAQGGEYSQLYMHDAQAT